MKKFAVGMINFFDNDLRIKIVETDGNWKDALKLAYNVTTKDEDNEKYYSAMPDDIEEAKTFTFDGDWMFDVVEI